jgi:hypothetical protein
MESMEVLRDARVILGAFLVAGCWIAFAEHPTAANLRQAVVETLEL